MSKLLITEHQDLYPNFARLAAVALVIPVMNADCERAFSTQNRQKTKLQNWLSNATLEHLICIETNGPPLTLHVEEDKGSFILNLIAF